MSKDKQSIQVTIRVRPLSDKQKQEDNRICVDVEEHTHSIQTFYGNQTKKFTFDSICNNNSQEDMFQKVGKKSTIYCLEGYNCTIFAYGQTGSGKTFTMMGVDPAHQNYDMLRGLIPRTLEYLFQSIDLQIKQTSSEYIIRCSFLQIYNEQIIDLLNPKNNNNLQIREDIKKGVYVEGISEETIFKGDEALDILKKGSKGRHVGSTCYNETSSRSHSVFTMQIESKHTKNGVVNTKIRYFHFIDLAGSERTKQINGDRLKEGCSINKSLHVLGKVINSLAESTENKPRHINYRDSKLTFLLKDSLGGNSKTHLIANVSPCTMSYSETNMTLAFARRVKLIKVNKASINEDMSGNLQSLKTEIKRLKQEIIFLRNGNMSLTMVPLMQSSESLQEVSNMSPLKSSQEKQTKMVSLLNQYVSDELQKQTKFELQIGKLYKKIECLENGIRKFSENETHLKMIIGVYEDKVARMKKAESLLTGKIDELSSQSEESMRVVEYFKQQRDELLKETDSYKKMLSQNSNILLKLLKSCKAYQGESSRQNEFKEEFISLLRCNTEFLASLFEEIKEGRSLIENELQGGDVSQLIQEKLAMMDLEYSKKETELMERIEQLQLQIGEIKTINQDNQLLLKQTVSREISLEEQLQQKDNELLIKDKQIRQMQEKVNSIQNVQNQYKQNKKKLSEEILSLKEENTKVTSQLRNKQQQIQQLTATQEDSIKSKLQLQEKLQIVTSQNQTLKSRICQLENQLVDSIKDYEERIFYSEQNIKAVQDKYLLSEQQTILLKEELKSKQCLIQQITFANKKQQQDTLSTIKQLEHRLSKQQKEINLMAENKLDYESRNKLLQLKLSALNDQMDKKLEEIQKLSLQLIHFKHESQSLFSKVTHLQSVIGQKEESEQQLLNKYKLKQDELLETINEMQSSTDSSQEEVNKIKIESLHLKQAKSQLQIKLNKLTQTLTETNLLLQNRTQKIHQLQLQLQEKHNKIVTEKSVNNQNKQTIRQLNYLLEEAKTHINNYVSTIKQKDQEFQQIHSKNIHLLQQLTKLQNNYNQNTLKSKQLETKLFCQEKTLQIQKDSLTKQNEKKVNKLNQLLNDKTSQVKKQQKLISQLKQKLQLSDNQIVSLKKLNLKNQQLFKQTLQKQLLNKSLETTQLKDTIALLQEQAQTNKQLLERTISDLKLANQELVEQIRSSKVRIEDLQKKESQLNLIIQEQREQIKELQCKIGQLRNSHQTQLLDLEEQHNQQLDAKNEQIQSKNEQIQSKNEQIQSKNQEIQSKNQQLDEMNQRIEGMNQRIQEMNRMIEQKEKLVEQKEKMVEQNIKRMNEKDKQIQEKDKQIQEKINQTIKKQQIIQSKQQQIQALKESIQGLRQQIEEKTNQIRQLEDTIKKNQNELSHRQTQIKQTNHRIVQETNQTISLLQEQNSSLSQQLEQRKKELDQLNHNLKDLEGQLESGKDQLQRMKEKISQLDERLEEGEEQRRELTSRLAQSEQSIKSLQKQLQERQSRIRQLKEELQMGNSMNDQRVKAIVMRKDQQIGQVQKKLIDLLTECDSKEEQNTLYQLQLNRVTLLVQQKDKQLKDLETEIRQLNDRNSQLEQKCIQLVGQNRQFKQSSSQYQSLKANFSQLNTLFTESSKNLQQKEKTIEEKEVLISQLNAQIYQLQNLYDQEHSQNVLLNNQLSQQSSGKESLEEEIRKLNSIMHELQQQNEEKKREKYLVQNKYQQLENKYQQLENKYQQLENKYQQLENKYQQLENKQQMIKKQCSNLGETNAQLQDTIKELNQNIHNLTQQLNQKSSLSQQLNQSQQTIHSQQQQLQKLSLQLQQSQHSLQSYKSQHQTLSSQLSQLSQQKEQLLQSYKSLQQINKGLGRKCQQFLTSIEEQKTQYRKLQTKYFGEKNINQNLKQLIENNQQQKKRLSVQLKEKTQIYHKLLDKIKSQSYHQHHSSLKTVQLNDKFKFEMNQLRSKNEELKKHLMMKTQLIEKRENELKEITKKSQEYSKTIQLKVKQFQADYLELQSKYEQLLQNKKLYEKAEHENTALKQQLQQTKPKMSRMTLRIEQLQEKIRSINQQCIELENENKQFRKKILYPGTNDDRIAMYLNKLKSEINDLKKEKQILEQTIKKETSEKMKLKTQLIKSQKTITTGNKDTEDKEKQHLKLQLERKLTEIRYLQQIIAEMIDILKIKQFQQGTNPKSIKIESIRKGIVTSIKEKIHENKLLKEKLTELQNRLNREKENTKSISSIVYNGVGSSNKKQTGGSLSSKTQKREKSFSLKQDDSAFNIKNRLNSTSGSGQYSQEKRQKRGVAIGQTVRTMVEGNEQTLYNNMREKMRVKEIISSSGKYYKNLQ